MLSLKHYSGTVFGHDLEDMGDGYLTNHTDLHVWQKSGEVTIAWSTFEGTGNSISAAWEEIQKQAKKADDEFCLSLRRNNF